MDSSIYIHLFYVIKDKRPY
uniref:Uncharacterized protein n=1 Tax=Anguilla anguilla TaxID=7936 RepID=A0A0E9REC6_ANGAN